MSRIINISGFGGHGPYAQAPAYDIVIQAISGMASVQSRGDTGTPDFVRTVVCDKITAVHAAQAICAALFYNLPRWGSYPCIRWHSSTPDKR